MQCGSTLRMLVPLAPLARERTRKYALYLHLKRGQEGASGPECDGQMDALQKEKKNALQKSTLKGRMSKLIENILSRHALPRITDSTDPLDQFLMSVLREKTNLLPDTKPASSSSSSSSTSSREKLSGLALNRAYAKVSVRPYQWDGVSWLLQLYRCGLGGILAGEIMTYLMC